MSKHDIIGAFPDTNIFLHYPPLDTIDWCDQLQAKRVDLIVCLPVVDELDAKKSDVRLSDRANKAIKKIQQYAGSTSPLRSGVGLKLYVKELTADSSSKDRHILEYVKEYQNETSTPVLVITEDYGMELRCKNAGVAVHRIDQSIRLADASDELTKKYREVVIELDALKNRLPKFQVWATLPGDKPSSAMYEAPRPISEPPLSIEAELAKQRRQHVKFSDRSSSPFGSPFASFISANDRKKYDNKLDVYYEEYRQYLELQNIKRDAHGRMIRFDLWLGNIGIAPAKDVRLAVAFPGERQLKIIEAEKLPNLKPPEPPEVPSPAFGLAGSMHENFGFHHQLRAILPALDLPRNPHQSCSCGEGYISFSVAKVLHNVEPTHIESFVAIFGSHELVGTIQSEYTITAAELPQPVTGKLVFKLHR